MPLLSEKIGTSLGAAPSGFGSQYDNLFAANPYRNLTYNKSVWQQLLSSFGFRTDADRWREDAQVNAAEYDAGIFSMMQQNQYNSPEAQAERMRVAGLNPDLLGTGDVANAAQPVEDPNGMPSNVGNDEFNRFGEGVISVLSRSIATFSDFLGLRQMQNVINAGNIDNARSMLGTIDSIIEGAFTSVDFKDQSSFDDAVANLNTRLTEDISSDWKLSIPYQYGFNKKQRQQFYTFARNRLNSIMGNKIAWSRYKERNEAISAARQTRSNPFYVDDYDAQQEEVVSIFSTNLAELARAKMSLDAQAAKKASKVEDQYQQERIDQSAGIAQAQSEVAEFDANWYMKQLQGTIGRVQKQILDDLQSAADSGSSFAKHCLINWSLNNMVNYNFNVGANLSLGANFGLSAISKLSR